MAEQRNEARNGRNGTGGTLIPWAAFIIGAGTSVAANVAHAAERAEQAGTGGMLFAAWAPIALLLVAEMITRGRRRAGAMAIVQWAGAGLVALAAAVVSFGHMRGLLLSYGESELVAILLPLSVDGLVLVASVALASGPERRNVAVQAERNEAVAAEPVPAEQAEPAAQAALVPAPERNEVATAEPVPAAPAEQAERHEAVTAEPVPAQERNEAAAAEQAERNEAAAAEPVPAAGRNEDEAPEAAERNEDEVPAEPVPSVPDARNVREHALEVARDAVRNGQPLTGAELAAWYGKSDRWGRKILREVRAELVGV